MTLLARRHPLGTMALALVLSSQPLRAATTGGGSVSLTSDYVVRGISRTNQGAALQADLHVASDTGWLAGLFASNAQVESGDRRSAELDALAGYAWQASDDWRTKVEAAYYGYVGSDAGSKYNYAEISTEMAYAEWLDLLTTPAPPSGTYLVMRACTPLSMSAPSGTRENPHHRDAQLVEAIGRGDRAALDELYLCYHRRLARFLSRISARYENVEEIINDTFMAVWQGAAQFRGASRVSTWIIGIAYRIALKSLRRGTDGLLRADIGDRIPEESTDPMAVTELRDWIADALKHLPLEQRLTLELAYHLGHSVEEIAEITECPIGTVKARMFHAREKLRRQLPRSAGLTDTDTAPSSSPS